MEENKYFIHRLADVSEKASIGKGTKIWHQVHIREGVKIGDNCIIGKDVYIDCGVIIGNNVKIQNGCNIYGGSKIDDGVFLGPGVILTNDKYPRSINPDGTLKKSKDWQVGKIFIKKGVSLGAGVIVLPDILIGQFAMAAAGSVVTKDVPEYGFIMGIPAKLIGYVCRCGKKIIDGPLGQKEMRAKCKYCQSEILLKSK